MKVLVMLSGGVESTALIKYGLDKGYTVECLHVTFNNKSAMEHRQAKQIAEYYHVEYSQISIDISEYHDKQERHAIPRMDNPYWGCGLLTCAPIGGYNEAWYGTHLGETPPGASGPAGINLVLQGVGCETRVKSPLFKKTKKEQWEMLSEDVKQLVTSCNRIESERDYRRGPCGICEKCKEWKKFAISV